MSVQRRMMVGSGWKMTKGEAETRAFAASVTSLLAPLDASGLDLFVLPPFTSLAAARTAFAESPVTYGGQNMHWEESGSYTGEISGAMLTGARFPLRGPRAFRTSVSISPRPMSSCAAR